jgi:hypothetical protein
MSEIQTCEIFFSLFSYNTDPPGKHPFMKPSVSGVSDQCPADPTNQPGLSEKPLG